MPCLALLLACGAAALTAPAAPATRSPRRPPIPALHSLRLPAPLYLRPRPTLHPSARRRIPRPRLACRLHPALCPHPAARSAHLFALTRFARASPQRITSSQRPHTRARASPLFALRPRTPGLRPHSAPAWPPRLRPHPAALRPRALLPRPRLATPPSPRLRLRFAPAPALPPGLASP
ncbi:hypothetical protein B0H14DRAFT_2953398 [Mycena olivaceomarginata]|nr:hypothetical protein B0H14DRAFT_2953398 [Mycena olivaceomarginata]